MLVAGVDVGGATAKAVIMKDAKIISHSLSQTGPDVTSIAKHVIQEAAKKANLSFDDIEYVSATGYGRISIPFADKTLTEISCHALGAKWAIPETRMVIDIGGQDSKAIHVYEEGNVEDFVMNDKCAAGTGRFLEVIAGVLEIPLNRLGPISLNAEKVCLISNTCTVFAESEVVSLRAQKEKVEDIIAGIHRSVAKRVCGMARRMGFREPVIFSGGVAKNDGVQRAIEEEIETELIIPEEPQLIGAIGAALSAASGFSKHR
jgi:predicted CoA-substrate-specific enzyme activase